MGRPIGRPAPNYSPAQHARLRADPGKFAVTAAQDIANAQERFVNRRLLCFPFRERDSEMRTAILGKENAGANLARPT